MFAKRWRDVLWSAVCGLSVWRYGDGIALGVLAVLASVGLFQLTGSNRGLATILAVTCALTARFLGWRAGCAAATVATLAFDFLFVGAPLALFTGTTFNHALIYFGFFALAIISSPDINWLPRLPPVEQPNEKKHKKHCANGSDTLSGAASGEAAAYALIEKARPKGQTYLVTARMSAMVEAGKWSSYEAGFVHGLAKAALEAPAEDLGAADDDANDAEQNAWVLLPHRNVAARQPIGNE